MLIPAKITLNLAEIKNCTNLYMTIRAKSHQLRPEITDNFIKMAKNKNLK
jgi:hypothetical protein